MVSASIALQEMLRQSQFVTDTVLQEEAVTQLTQIVDDMMNDIPGQSRTGSCGWNTADRFMYSS